METGALVVAADYKDFEDYWLPFLAGSGLRGRTAPSLDDERRATLREACFRRLGSPAGSFTLSARAWFVRGSV